MRIQIFADFTTSQNCKEIFERHYGTDEDIEWVADDSYTHAIILNRDTPCLKVCKDKVIGFALEPPEFLNVDNRFVQYITNHCKKYFIGNFHGRANTEPFALHHGFLWHIPFLDPVKTNVMSIMVSDKKQAPGHLYRHELVKKILETQLPIDIYGTGCPKVGRHGPDARLKGKFSELEPYESYKFHVAIENYETEAYFSEKLSNCAVSKTVAVYLGAKSIPFTCIRLRGNVQDDIKILESICARPDEFYTPNNLDEVRKVLDIKPFLKQHFT